MSQNVSIGINAQPNQAVNAFKQIMDEARRLGLEIKKMSDLDMLPGLDAAKQHVRDINAGMQQMYSTAVRGNAAAALRSGRQAGLYSDAISWHQNVGRQFPDQHAQQRHIDAVLSQAGNIAAMGGGSGGGGFGGIPPGGMKGYAGPGMGAVIGGLMNGNIGGVVGGAAGGALGMMSANPIVGVIGAAVGSAIGSKLDSAIGHYAQQSMQESFGMSDLRRNVFGVNESFSEFRTHIREAGKGLGVTHTETLALAQTFSRLSGVSGSGAISSGTRAGIMLSRQFGLDPSQGASMMGRMSFLGLGGGDPKKQAQMLAEAMAGSNLGARQSDAAEAMLRFAEKSAGMVGDGGNIAGYTGRLMALFNSSDKGIRANAAGILGGYDESIRAGGRAGDAGKNFIYNVMSRNGTSNPFDIEMALEGGFAGKMGNGNMIGPELIKQLKSQYGGMGRSAMASATKGLFGGSATVADKVIDLLEKNPSMGDAEAAKKVDALMADLKKSDPGNDLRVASANLNNAAQELIGDNMLPIMTQMKTVLGDLTDAINRWTGSDGTSETRKKMQESKANGDERGRLMDMNRERDNATTWSGKDGNAGLLEKWGHKKYATERGMKSAIGDIGPDSASPGSGYKDEMSHSTWMRKFDTQAIMDIDAMARKHHVTYKTIPSARGSGEELSITGGSQASAEKFAHAVESFGKMIGVGVRINVKVDKNGNAVVPRPSHNTAR